ncbi:MAG TPA: MerR family transcriptional regulator [Chloroflexia bacterium]
MTINELATRAGVTTRTIRYYVEQGLLPAPERGRPAEYTEDHVQRLDLIRRLKDQYLPLEEIRAMLERLDRKEIEQVLAPAPPVAAARARTSAVDYIADVLGRGATREKLKTQPPPRPLPPGMAPPPASLPPDWAPPVPLPPAPAAVPPPAPAPQTLAPPQYLPAIEPAPTTWQRVPLAPGVELHYLMSGDARTNELVDRLVEAAGRILAEMPESNGEKL